MMFKEIVIVYSEKHSKTHKYKTQSYWLLNQLTRIVSYHSALKV
jgi:hypothetical protein